MPRRLLLCLFAVGVFLLSASPLHARERAQGWCEQGGNTLAVIGAIVTADKAQESFPGCTVTVWDAGTMNLATIFSDDIGTTKANPFTAGSSDGLWSFYADNSRYDVQLSGGGIVTPFTLADWLLDDATEKQAVVVQTATVTFSATPTFDSDTSVYFSITLTGNVTSSTISNAVAGRVVYFNICQDGTGGRTFAWDALVLTPPLVNAAASLCTSASFIYDGTNWRELAATVHGLSNVFFNQVESSVINVRAHGATGDGTTDDTVNMQAAIDAVAGATVFIPCGTYRVQDLVLRNGVTLVGAGSCTVLRNLDVIGVNAFEDVIDVGVNSTCDRCGLFDMVLDGNQTFVGRVDENNHALDIGSGTTNLVVARVHFRDTIGDGIFVGNQGSASPDVPTDVVIVDCHFEDHSRQDIAAVAFSHLTISNNIGDGNLDVEPVAPQQFLTVTGNVFDLIAVSNADTALATRANFTISGNVSTGKSVENIIFGLRGATVTGNTWDYVRISNSADIIFEGNTVRTLDIWPTATLTGARNIFRGNHISHVDEGANATLGTGVDTRIAAVTLWRQIDTVFEGNWIRTKERGIEWLPEGATHRVEIRGNTVIYENAAPPSPRPNGLDAAPITANAEETVIADNYFEGFESCLDIVGSTSLNNALILRNICNDAQATGQYGFEFISVLNSLIDGNILIGDYNGVNFGGLATGNTFTHNFFMNSLATLTSVQNSAAAVRFGWNRHAVQRTTPYSQLGGAGFTWMEDTDFVHVIPAGTTSPQVEGHGILITANTGSTTITSFSGSLGNGKIFTLIIGDNFTTIATNPSISMLGNANELFETGDVLQFILDGTLYRQMNPAVGVTTATASLDFTALAANSCEILSVTTLGAVVGDPVSLGIPNTLADVDGATERTTFFGWVSSANIVAVRRCNVTGTVTLDPAAATVRASVWRH